MRYIYFILMMLCASTAFASQVLVIVDGKAITSADVEKRIEAIKLANPEVENSLEMNRYILNNLISEELFRNEAKRLKISVDAEEVKQQFKEVAEEHKFSNTTLEAMMKNQSLYKQVESQVLWNKLVSTVLYNRIKVSNAEIREEQKLRKEVIKEVSFKQILFNSYDDKKIEKMRLDSGGCENLDQLAKQNGLNKPTKNTVLFTELNPELQAIIRTTPENKLSEVINYHNLKQVIMVCNKNIISDPKDVHRIRQELVNRKINAEAQKYLAELKKRIYIEYIEAKN